MIESVSFTLTTDFVYMYHKEKGFWVEEPVTEEISMATTLMGIREVFAVKDSKDLIVMGRVQGIIKEGAAVYLTNCGEDDETQFLTVVKNIETGPAQPVNEASDCMVALRLENGSAFRMKKGTVLFSRDATMGEVLQVYTATLGDVFVAKQNLEISEQDFSMLSIADCSEIWRLFVWFRRKATTEPDEEQKKVDRERLNRLGAQLCKKIMSAEEIYCVFSKITGEPHMSSKTVNRGDGTFMCTPPNITIGTKRYAEAIGKRLSADKFEFRKIEAGEDKKGIYNFLGSTFYLNGACGVIVQSDDAVIDARMLVAPPDYSQISPQNIPVTNPDLMRWMLLIGQMGKPESEDAQIIYKLYYKFMATELVKARLLIPMQHDGGVPEADEEGKTVLQKDTKFKFPTMKGKTDRPAVHMYTDWKRLRMMHGEEWGGMVQPVSGMIDFFDCAINPTQFPAAGCYVNKEMFEEMNKNATGESK